MTFRERAIEALLPYCQEDKHDANKALDALLLIIEKEVVPLPWSIEGSEPEKTVGWNACRKEMIERMMFHIVIDDVSYCHSCLSMTYTVKGLCGKCGGKK